MIAILFFIVGVCAGSFLNVCIYRIPRNLSIIFHRSSCVKCGKLINFYNNIPIISYLILGAKCPFCNSKISLRYIIVESLGGIFGLLCVIKFGVSFDALANFVFTAILIIVVFIDIEYMIIPDIITLPLTAVFFIFSIFFKKIPYFDSILGIITGGGSLLILSLVHKAIMKKEGIGGGDIKLIAMIGSFIGIKGVIFTIVISAILGSLVGIVIIICCARKLSVIKLSIGKFALPFGPFLSMGAVLYIFLGEGLIKWYMNFWLALTY